MIRTALITFLFTVVANAATVKLVDDKGVVVPIDGRIHSEGRVFPLRGGVAEIALDEQPAREVTLDAPGWWMLPGTITEAGLEARVWPTGLIRGSVLAAEGTTVPAEFDAVVEVPPFLSSPPIPRGTKFPCKTQGGSFTCVLPVTTVDLVFRSKGLTPTYKWQIRVTSTKASDVGVVRWRKGGSLVAWLDRDSARIAKEKPVRATLTPSVSGDPSAVSARLSVPAAEATFNEHGSVQLSPLHAGLYQLQITAPGFARTNLGPIEVFEASESVLRRPIALQPPINIAVAIEPALDPSGERWKVRFHREADPGSPMSASGTREFRTNESGEFVVENESPGRFVVSVEDAHGNRVARSPFTVSSVFDAGHRIRIEQHPVEGFVTLGGKPLEAELIFGTRHGAERMIVQSNEEGRFFASLSKLGPWVVEIEKRSLSLQRIKSIDVRKDKRIEIHLPDGQITGVVQDANGPASEATVTVFTGTVPETHSTDASGRFHIRGLEGSVRLSANASNRRESQPMTIDVGEGKTIDGVVLRLEARKAVDGRVTVGGQPLPGAGITVYAESGGTVMTSTSDLDGRFKVTLSEHETMATFVVAAAGRTLSAFRMPIAGHVTLPLDPVGGDVTILLKDSDDVSLYRDGALLRFHDLFRWSRSQGRELFDAQDNLAVTQIAPGLIRACAPTKTRGPICREALLVPRGTITLDLR